MGLIVAAIVLLIMAVAVIISSPCVRMGDKGVTLSDQKYQKLYEWFREWFATCRKIPVTKISWATRVKPGEVRVAIIAAQMEFGGHVHNFGANTIGELVKMVGMQIESADPPELVSVEFAKQVQAMLNIEAK